MFRHENDKQCDLCALKLKDVNPLLVSWFLDLKKRFPSAHISWGFRGKEDQDIAFKNKKSRLKWPESKHNIIVDERPCSSAIDLFCLDEAGQACFPFRYFEQIWMDLKKNDEPIAWGGLWKKPPDFDHFELK